MPENNRSVQDIVSCRTKRRIRIGVTAAHLLVVIFVLTFSVISEWIDQPEDTISVEFYDPTLTNEVENPSPDPSENNPIPPSGTQDGGAPDTPEPPAEVEPADPKQLTPEPVQSVVQPAVTKRRLPRKISKPKQVSPVRAKAVKQPKVTKRRLPGKHSSNAAKSDRANKNTARRGKPGPRGSNRQSGHTAPGGQRGNSNYDQLVAGMIYRMWVTPDKNRLGGRRPRVGIELVIDADGRVIRKRITHRSNVLAMDESVQNLLDSLQRVIVPFDRQAHTLRFAITIQD